MPTPILVKQEIKTYMKKIIPILFGVTYILLSNVIFSQGYNITGRYDTLTNAFFPVQTDYGMIGVDLDSLMGKTIDTVTISNDSVFIHTQNGDSVFTGVADAPRPNNGRVWYVSKTNLNCSNEAAVGDPTQPFCNPWQAMDSVQSGDEIQIFSGDYVVGDVGSGADVEITGVQSMNLWFEGTIVMHSNANILLDFTVATDDPILFDPGAGNNGDTLYVVGNGSVLTPDEINVNKHSIFSSTDVMDSSFLFMDLNRIQCYNFIANNGTNEVGGADVKLNSLTFFNWALTPLRANYYSITAENIIQKSGSGLASLSNIASGNVREFRVKNYFNKEPSNIYTGGFGGMNDILTLNAGSGVIDSAYIYIKIDAIYIDSNDADFDNYSKLLNIRGTGDFTNSVIIFENKFFDCKSIADRPLVHMFQTPLDATTNVYLNFGDIKYSGGEFFHNTSSSNGSIFFDVKNLETDASQPVFNLNAAPTNIHISGRYASESSNVLYNNGATGDVQIENGYFKSPNNLALINTNTEITLFSSRLINDGTVAPIESSTAVNVNCMNVYSNSTIVDADVTEQIESIVRDANVK